MAFVVTSGQLTAVQQTTEYDQSPWGWRSVTLSSQYAPTYEELWRTQPALRTVTSFLARNVAQLSIDPYRRISATDREKALDHPLAMILERPLAESKWTKYRLLNTLMQDLCIFDNAYWIKMKGTTGVLGVQPVPPARICARGTDLFRPDYYRLTGNLGYRDFKPDQVVHFHGYAPDDARMGVAPVETLRLILAEEHAASVYRQQMWRNGARTAGYLFRPLGAPKWPQDRRDRFRAEWQAQYTGDGPAAGGTPVLEDGMGFNAASITPRDAQYVESRELTREEVAIAYHVPPVMLGIMKGATFSNIVELHKMLYQDTLGPWLEQIQQDIEVQLLDDLDPDAGRDRRVYVEFNLQAKLAGSFEEQAKAMQSAVGGPWMTRDEARGKFNLPHIEGADDLIVPLNVTTGGLASPNDTAPDNPSNEASNGQLPKAADIAPVLRRFFQRQGKAVAARIGAGERDPVVLVDADRWDAELMSDLAGISMPPTWISGVNDHTREGVARVLSNPGIAHASVIADIFTDYADRRAQRIANQLEMVS